MGNIEISTLTRSDIRMPEFMKSAYLSLKACPVPGSDMLSQLILTVVFQDRHYYPYFADDERRAHKV